MISTVDVSLCTIAVGRVYLLSHTTELYGSIISSDRQKKKNKIARTRGSSAH
jgi:hypothetical protein